MPCRVIISPKTGEQVQSQTWNDIYSLTKDEAKADQLYDQLTSEPFLQWFGDWVNDPDNASKVVNEHGEPLVVYHGTKKQFNTFFDNELSYFHIDSNTAKSYGNNVLPSFLNIKRPYFEDGGNLSSEDYDILKDRLEQNNTDGYISDNKVIFVTNNSNQIKSVYNTGAFSGESDNIYYQLNNLRDYNNQFDKDLVQAKMDRLPSGHVLQMGKPGAILQKAGLDNIPIQLPVSNLIDAANKPQKGHKFDLLDIMGLVKAINFPELIVQDKDFRNRILISTPITDQQGRRFNVSIELNKTIKDGVLSYEVNSVRTIFPRSSDYGLLKQIEAGDLLYVQKEKALKYLEERWNNPTAPSQNSELGNKVRKIILGFTNTVSEEDVKYYQDAFDKIETPSVSSKTIQKLRAFAQKVGINIEALSQITVNGKPIGINGVAHIMEALVQYVEGKETTTLPEELYHIAVEMLEQSGDPLFKEMLNAISSKPIYRQTLAEYKNNPNYQKDGKPDIRKIKKEAIAKQLVIETARKENWWKRFIDFFKNLLSKGGNPFSKVAEKVLSSDFETGAAIGLNSEESFFQLSDEQRQKQKTVAQSFEDRRTKYNVRKEVTKGALDEDEVNRYMRTLNGKDGEPRKRVTDFVRDSKTPAQLAKFENAPDVRKKEWKQKAALGTAFHAQAENIVRYATDSEGYLKPHDQLSVEDFHRATGFPEALASALYYYLVGNDIEPGVLYTSFPEGTMFRVEEIVYDNRSSRDVAGTIDLIGITPEGKIRIWDWKTKFLDTEKYDDVPFYSQKDYRIQLGQYKNIMASYGIKPEQVEVAQAQPIVFDGDVDEKGNVSLTGAQFPTINVNEEDRKYLVPVPVQDQSTGNQGLDEFISQLYRLYDILYKQKSDDWAGKIEQLNSIAGTIRELQIKKNFDPLTSEALVFLASIEKSIIGASLLVSGKKGFENIEGGEAGFKKALSSVLLAMKNIDKYVNVHTLFKQVYEGEELTEEQQAIEQKLSNISAQALQHKADLKKSFEQLMDFFARTKGVENILQAEKEITGWIDSDVQSTSRLQTSALNLFYKLESRAKSERDVAIDKSLKSFGEKLNALKEYAKKKGIAMQDAYTLLTGKKDRWKMVDRVKKEAYTELEEATDKAVNFFWINENIDVKGFEKEMKDRLAAKLQEIDEEVPEDADEELVAQAAARKDYYKKHWNVDSPKGLGWFDRDTLKKYLKEDKWYTDEYRAIMNDKPLIEMYQWIEEFNRAAFKAGYYDGVHGASYRSLPWVRGSFLDKIGKGGVKAFSETLKDIYTIHQEEEHMYRSSKDAKLKNIPKPFTHNLGKKEDGTYDLSGISTDLGQTMALYIQSVLDFQHTKQIEDYVEALVMLEESKGHLRKDKGRDTLSKDVYGNFIVDEGNERNTKILEEQVEALIYKQYFDENTGLPPTATKLIEKGNDYLRLKVFSLNLLTPVINTLGSTMQGMINSGKLFKGREWGLNFMRFMTNKLQGEEGAVRKGLLDYFGLLHSNERGERVKQMSLQQLHRHSIKDTLLGLMRLSDALVHGATGLSMLENTMVAPDGKLVNIREFVRNSPEFRKVYDKNTPYAERKALEKTFEKKVQELKEQKSLVKISKFNEQGILEIEGITRESDAYHAYRNIIRNEVKKITGMITEDEKRNMERNILWKSMLMFKGWIPRLAEVRFGQIKHNHATEEYEMGRTRLWFDILVHGTEQGKRDGNIMKGLVQGIKDLGDMRKANDRGLELLAQYYRKVADNYYARTGKELKMTPEEFYQMTREAIVMQYKDVALLMSLFTVFASAKALPPPDDDDQRNARHMMIKALDKLKDEVSFYYNPVSLQQIFGGTLIPSLGVLSDVLKTVNSTGVEIFGSEESKEKNQWIKRMMQNFPITQQMASFFLPLIDQEFAKELGIRVNEESRLNR